MCIGIVGEVAGDVVIVDMEFIGGKQYERCEIRRPPDSVFPRIVKDMTNTQIVAGEDQLTLQGPPDGHGPVADYAVETIGAPPRKCSRDNGYVRLICR